MIAITDLSQLDPNGTYSYADYLTWKFEEVIELVKGKVLPMSAPSRKHQDLSWRLTIKIDTLFRNHRCKAYAAPFDVRLYDKKKSVKANKDIFTVVQPDLCVICDLKKLDDRGCLGSPDFIIEILSPGNSMREMKIKKDLYAENGVREYWIVDYDHEMLTRFQLEGEDRYGLAEIFVSTESVTSTVFPDFTVKLEDLFLP